MVIVPLLVTLPERTMSPVERLDHIPLLVTVMTVPAPVVVMLYAPWDKVSELVEEALPMVSVLTDTEPAKV